MRRFMRLPAALALFVFTAHPEGVTTKSSRDHSDTTKDQQTHLTQEQRNQQSTFDPQRVSDTELKKNVSEVNKASSFMGMSVENLQKDKLGTVKDLVFDPDSGKISYAVLGIGGVFGVGDKLIAVPLGSLRPERGEKYLVLNMTRDEVKNAPGLAKNNWPSLNDPALGGPASSEHSGSSSSKPSSSSSDHSSSSSDPASTSSHSSDQLSAPKSDASNSKDAQGSSPSASSGSSSSSDKTTTSNSGKASGASPSTTSGSDTSKSGSSNGQK